MGKYNEVKIEIFSLLDDLGVATAEDIADDLGRSHDSTSMALLDIIAKA